MSPLNQSTKIIRALLFTCLLVVTLAGCAPGSTVSPTVILASTTMPALTSTATPILTSTFTPVPTSTSTPRPIPPVVECSECKIAYIADSDGFPRLYTMNEDGSKPTLITPKDLDSVYGFALSPNGHRVAFQSGSQVYTMNLDGSNLVSFTQNLAFDGAPYRSSMSWSPDGTQIAFTFNNNLDNHRVLQIYVANADGSNLVNLGQNLVPDSAIAWSPDGSKIAFAAFVESGPVELHTIHVDSTNAAIITFLGSSSRFAWSPDGSQFFFQYCKYDMCYPFVFLIAADGHEQSPRQLPQQSLEGDLSSPTWSPDGSKIAFVLSSSDNTKPEIAVLNIDGENISPLTQNSKWDNLYDITWSPGGSKIAFKAGQGGNEYIYRLNADGSKLTQLTKRSGVVYSQIAWASSPVPGPDAAATEPPSALAESCDKFAFVSTDADRNPGPDYRKYAFGVLFVKNIDGSDMFALSDNVSWRPWDSPRIVWSPDGRSLAFESGVSNSITVSKIETPDFIEIRDDAYPRLNAPDWSPDGRRIAFSFQDNPDDEAMEIGVTNAAGGTITNLTRNPADDQKPDWSPDGRKIAFLSTRDGVFSDLYLMNADGSNVTRLTQDIYVDSFPVWSPDGSKIAFSDGNDIYVIDADGSGLNNLTFNSAKNNSPVWSPDGLKIAFESNSQGNAEIFVMNADGSNVLNLTEHPGNDYLPVWSSDGSKLLFQTDRDGKSEIYMTNADGSNPINMTNRPDYLNESPVWMPCPPSK